MGWFFILVVISLIILSKSIEKIKLFRNYKKGIQEFQKKHNLTDSEVKLFKETMDLAKNQIIEWEKTVEFSLKLKKSQPILVGIKSSKEIFKYFMEFPNGITIFNDFLYIKLPGVLAASKKYTIIESSEILTDEVKESLEIMLTSLVAISESITDDYEKSVKEELSEIEITKKMVERHD